MLGQSTATWVGRGCLSPSLLTSIFCILNCGKAVPVPTLSGCSEFVVGLESDVHSVLGGLYANGGACWQYLILGSALNYPGPQANGK